MVGQISVYRSDYLENEGVCLQNVQKNPGLRSLSKLELNSFWGIFGQRRVFTQSRFVNES